VHGDRRPRRLTVERILLREQLLKACLPRRQLTLQRDHLAEVLRLVEQRTNSADARACGEDLGIEVSDLVGHVVGGALEAGAPADSGLKVFQKCIHLSWRQLEHEVAGSELRRRQVEAGVVQLASVSRREIDHLVDCGSCISNLETNRHNDNQLSVRWREHLSRNLGTGLDHGGAVG